MAGIALILNLDGRPAEERELAPVRDALAHRGPDGCRTVTDGPLALAVHRFWTTPEEQGEEQPLHDPETGAWLALDGRLDNREELLAALGAGPELAGAPDAALALLAWRRWGDAWVERVVGPFVAVAAEPRRGRVTLWRDPLGSRMLAYAVAGRTLVAASEPWAVTRHAGVPCRPSEIAELRFLAAQGPPWGETYFEGVRELPPGFRLAAEGDAIRLHRFWEPPRGRLALGEREAVAAFREALEAAVRARLRAPGRIAVQMSGGLDSTSVAALAARELERRGEPPPLAVSWVFREIPSADERRWIGAMRAGCRIEGVDLWGDGLPPLARPADHAPDRSDPSRDLYVSLHVELCRLAREAAARVCLSGHGGDQSLAGWAGLARDAVRAGRPDLALAWLAWVGWRHRRDGLRAVAGAAAASVGIRRRRRWRAPAWVRPEHRAALEGSVAADPPECREAPWSGYLSGYVRQGHGLSAAMGARRLVEPRTPYHDLRLVTVPARLPRHLVHRPGWYKWLLREAVRGVLPEPVRRRRRATTLMDLARRGLMEAAHRDFAAVLAAPGARWRRWLVPGIIEGGVLAGRWPERDGLEAVLPWLAWSLETWYGALQGGLKGDVLADLAAS